MQVAEGVECINIKPTRRNRPFKSYTRQAGATGERIIADARHAIGYGNARQAGTVIERTFADARHTAGYRYACQASTAVERIIADARHAIGYGNARQAGTVIERTFADALAYASRSKINGGYLRTVTTTANIEQVCRYFGYVCSDVYRYTSHILSGVIKYIAATGQIGKGRHVIVYLCQATTVGERRIADTRYTTRYRYARQTVATVERITSDA